MPAETALYARVSTSQQDTASQEPDLLRWAAAHGVETTWYRDKCTGKTMARKGWDRLWADVLSGKIKTIIVWRLDRLGRTAKGLVCLFDDLREHNVNLVSIREGFDLRTPAGRLMANMLASVAAYETEVRSERQMAGIAVAQAAGVRFGRPAGVHTRVKVKPEQEATIRRLKAEGTPIAHIARAVGLSRPTVYSVLGSGTV